MVWRRGLSSVTFLYIILVWEYNYKKLGDNIEQGMLVYDSGGRRILGNNWGKW